MRGATREYEFEPAQDGIASMIPMSYTDIEYANSKNPNLFVTGLLTFSEHERDEIYNALNFPDWKDRFWTEESIADAILRPNVAKMQRILDVRDILTIERIRGAMTRIINTSIQRPIEKVIDLINDRWQEILRGQRVTKLEVSLPSDVIHEDKEKAALAAQNAQMEEKMREMERQIALLMQKQTDAPETATPTIKKPPIAAKKNRA